MYGVTCLVWYIDVNKVTQFEALFVKSLIYISFIVRPKDIIYGFEIIPQLLNFVCIFQFWEFCLLPIEDSRVCRQESESEIYWIQ